MKTRRGGARAPSAQPPSRAGGSSSRAGAEAPSPQLNKRKAEPDAEESSQQQRPVRQRRAERSTAAAAAPEEAPPPPLSASPGEEAEVQAALLALAATRDSPAAEPQQQEQQRGVQHPEAATPAEAWLSHNQLTPLVDLSALGTGLEAPGWDARVWAAAAKTPATGAAATAAQHPRSTPSLAQTWMPSPAPLDFGSSPEQLRAAPGQGPGSSRARPLTEHQGSADGAGEVDGAAPHAASNPSSTQAAVAASAGVPFSREDGARDAAAPALGVLPPEGVQPCSLLPPSPPPHPFPCISLFSSEAALPFDIPAVAWRGQPAQPHPDFPDLPPSMGLAAATAARAVAAAALAAAAGEERQPRVPRAHPRPQASQADSFGSDGSGSLVGERSRRQRKQRVQCDQFEWSDEEEEEAGGGDDDSDSDARWVLAGGAGGWRDEEMGAGQERGGAA